MTICKRCRRGCDMSGECPRSNAVECLELTLARIEGERDKAISDVRGWSSYADARRVQMERAQAQTVATAKAAQRARRDLADAKAEVERLRKLFDDAGQGEHNVLALVDHYIAEAEKAERERDIYMAAWVADDDLRTEADELRRLAWEWCIEARYHYSMANDAHREADELRAEKAGPLPTAVLAQTEPPIESLGPVPVKAEQLADLRDGYTISNPRTSRAIAWLVRDAVRRGAKLEGEGR